MEIKNQPCMKKVCDLNQERMKVVATVKVCDLNEVIAIELCNPNKDCRDYERVRTRVSKSQGRVCGRRGVSESK